MGRKKGKDIPCHVCGKISYIQRNRLAAVNFCSLSCASIHKHKTGKFGYSKRTPNIDWVLIQNRYDDGYSMNELSNEYKITKTTWDVAIAKKLFNKWRGKKHSIRTKERLSKLKKEFLSNNPDKHSWNVNKKISVPCEKFKNILRETSISFMEEYRPLQDRFFLIDVVFPEKKLGIEINGNQHYNNDLTLKEYYQKRHDLIELAGWKLLEIHFSVVFDKIKLEELINFIKQKNIINDFKYEFYIKQKKIVNHIPCSKSLKQNKDFKFISTKNSVYGNRLQYTEAIKTFWDEKQQKYIQIILDSNVDFSKFGWVEKIAVLINQKPQKVNKWMKRIMPIFYEKYCFKRNHSPVDETVS